jgi:SAM-dependent methyltransferase
VLENADEIERRAFDVVVCIEVLEHVTNPLGVLARIHEALRPGGIALITESFDSIGPAYPSHLVENFKYAGQVHRIMEGLGFANTYYNTDPINRPMEFRRVSGIEGSLLRQSCRLRRAVESRARRFLRRRSE